MKWGEEVGNFQRDIRRALIKYALVPVFMMALLCIVFGVWSWQHYVVQKSQDTTGMVADVLETLVSDYGQRLAYIAQNEDFTDIRHNMEHRRSLYEWLYRDVNISHDGTLFFLVSDTGDILMSNHRQLPEYLQSIPMNWGIWQRMAAQQEGNIMEFSPRSYGKNSDLLLGRAVVRSGVIMGYWLFIIPGDYLSQAINSPPMDFAIVSVFGHAVVTTDNKLRVGDFQVLPREYSGKNQQIATIDQSDFYVTQQPVGESAFTIYGIMPVSDIEARYGLVAAVLDRLNQQKLMRSSNSAEAVVADGQADNSDELTDWLQLLQAEGLNPYVRQVLEWIQADYTQRLSIENMAEELQVSTSYLSRKLKEATGHTFGGLLARYRLREAIKLLQDGRYRVYEIAEHTGFGEYKNFAQVFKKYLHISPKQYMQQRELKRY